VGLLLPEEPEQDRRSELLTRVLTLWRAPMYQSKWAGEVGGLRALTPPLFCRSFTDERRILFFSNACQCPISVVCFCDPFLFSSPLSSSRTRAFSVSLVSSEERFWLPNPFSPQRLYLLASLDFEGRSLYPPRGVHLISGFTGLLFPSFTICSSSFSHIEEGASFP